MYKTFSLILVLTMGSLSLINHDVFAQSSGQNQNMYLRPNPNGIYEVPIHKSGIIPLKKPAKRISVGNPGIADILILRNKELYILGKALGSTNITVWDRNNRIIASYETTVTHDLDSLKLHLYELLPGEPIEVRSTQGRIVLSGEVSNIVKMKSAVTLAQSFLPKCKDCKEGGVINLMQVGGAQQVMLEVKVAEVARRVMRELDSQFNFFNFGGNNSIGGIVSGGTQSDLGGDDNGLLGSLIGVPANTSQGTIFFGHLGADYLLSALLSSSKTNGLAKILAEPTLVTLTGQEAKFLSGGEFPIPVPGQLGQVTIDYKEFGVALKFLPIVLDSGRINMKINVDVSELSDGNSVTIGVAQTASNFFIPALTKRSAASTLELADGQTIGIAGLLSDNTRTAVERLPALGEVPVLGALFSSQQYMSGQTELVIFVTPHLAKPIDPEKVRLPTDAYIPPNDLEFYLLGQIEAMDYNTEEGQPSSSTTTSTSTTDGAGGLDGASFGHSL